MTREWITLSEAARWAQERFAQAGRSLSRKTVSRWALEGKIRAKREDKRWYIHLQSLILFVDGLLEGSRPSFSSPDPVRRAFQERNAQFLKDLNRGID